MLSGSPSKGVDQIMGHCSVASTKRKGISASLEKFRVGGEGGDEGVQGPGLLAWMAVRCWQSNAGLSRLRGNLSEFSLRVLG